MVGDYKYVNGRLFVEDWDCHRGEITYALYSIHEALNEHWRAIEENNAEYSDEQIGREEWGNIRSDDFSDLIDYLSPVYSVTMYEANTIDEFRDYARRLNKLADMMEKNRDLFLMQG